MTLEDDQLPAGRRVPNACGLVLGRRDDPRPVRAVLRGEDPVVVALQQGCRLARRRIPDARVMIERPGQDVTSVRTEHGAHHVPDVALQDGDLPTGRDVPNPRRPVRRRRDDPRPLRVVGGEAHGVGVPSENEDVLARRRVPDARGLVERGRQHTAPVGAEAGHRHPTLVAAVTQVPARSGDRRRELDPRDRRRALRLLGIVAETRAHDGEPERGVPIATQSLDPGKFGKKISAAALDGQALMAKLHALLRQERQAENENKCKGDQCPTAVPLQTRGPFLCGGDFAEPCGLASQRVRLLLVLARFTGGASVEIGQAVGAETVAKIRAQNQGPCGRQAFEAVIQPGVLALVADPFRHGPLDTVDHLEIGDGGAQPGSERRPLPQEAFVRHLDDVDVRTTIRNQKTGGHEAVDDRAGTLRDFAQSRDPPHRRASLDVDPCKPWDEGGAQREHSRFLVAGYGRRPARIREGALDCGLERALQAADGLVIRQGNPAARAIVGEKPLEDEAEQRQRVGALCVGDEPLGQSAIDRKLAAGIGHQPGGPLDDAFEFRRRDGKQVEQVARHVRQTRFGLKQVVAIRPDRREEEDASPAAAQGCRQQRGDDGEKRLGFRPALRVEQFLRLVERNDDCGLRGAFIEMDQAFPRKGDEIVEDAGETVPHLSPAVL